MKPRHPSVYRYILAAAALAFAATTLVGCRSLTAAPSPQQAWHGQPWMIDYDAACERARETGKNLLVHFSGSDWSEWCVRLNREVFANPDFLKGCTNDLVLVVLDFPCQPANKEAIPEKLTQRYIQLRGEFQVGAFPSILLTDPDGLPFGRFGYTGGDPKSLLAQVRNLLDMKAKRDEAIKTLETACPTGLERARLLHEMLSTVPRNIADLDYRDVMAEIAELDAENKEKLRSPYLVRLARLDAADAARTGKIGNAIGIYRKLITGSKPEGQLLQDLWFEKSVLHGKADDLIGQCRCLESALLAARTGTKALEIYALVKELAPKARDLRKNLYAGEVISTMGAHVDHPLEHAYDFKVADTYYLSDRPPKAGDVIALILNEARDVVRVGVYTGHEEGDGGLLRNGVLEVSPDGRRFQAVTKIQGGRGQARISGAKLKVVRIRVVEDQDYPVMVREFLLD